MTSFNITFGAGVPFESGAVVPTSDTSFQFPSGYYETTVGVPLQKMYPLSDGLTPTFSHHRCAHPGMRWECPVRAMGGSNPRFYEIVQAPAGMTLGGFLTLSNGAYVADRAYGLLTWNTPVVGTHKIVIRCTDQTGKYVTFRWTLICATGLHMFVAPTSQGTGDGSTKANAKAESSVFLNGNTTPAAGKVIVMCGGAYTSTYAITLDKSNGAASCIGYPGEVAIWGNKVKGNSDDNTIGFITIKNASTDDFGIVGSYSIIHRFSSFYNTFDSCYNSLVPQHNNQACHGFSSGGTNWRDNILICDNTYIDCAEVGAFDCYNVNSILCQKETWIVNNLSTPQHEFIWFPKARIKNYEISFNTYDNPAATGYCRPIHAYNGVDGNAGLVQTVNGHVEYNYIRVSSLQVPISSNAASNTNITYFTTTINNNPNFVTYHLANAGFTTTGGILSFAGYGDLAIGADGTTTASGSGFITAYWVPKNGVGVGNTYKVTFSITASGTISSIVYNLVATGTPGNPLPFVVFTNYVRRNTFIGGMGIDVHNWNADYYYNRRTILTNNSVSTALPVVTDSGPVLAADWFITSGNLIGGAIDAVGKPVDTQQLGKVGAIIYKP